MPANRHDPVALAEFQDGERCLVWARVKADGSLYRLDDGTARALKVWAKEHLECFMPDCEARRLTTVARHPRRRDGFSHYQGAGGHSLESEAHQQGKAALVEWVTATLGPEGVAAVAEQSTSDRKRIADVMVTWPGGRQVALEVQYAPLSVEHWQTRHDSYREQGIVDVWLLGHVSRHLQQARRHAWEREGATDGLVTLGDLHAAIAEAGAPVLWINPVTADGAASIGTVAQAALPHLGRTRPYGDGHDGATFQVPAAPPTARGVFLADPLAACALTPDGMVTPTLDRLRRAAAELGRVDAARRADDQARAAAERAARQAKAERDRAGAESRARWLQERKAEQQAAWDTSGLRERVLARHGGKVPSLFTVNLGGEGGIYAPAAHWRAAVYRDCVWNKTCRSFTVAAAHQAIRDQGIPLDRSQPGARSRAVVGWLLHLERQGYVDIERDPENRSTVLRVVVRGDLENRPPPRTRPEPPPATAAAPVYTPQRHAPPSPPEEPKRPQPGERGWARAFRLAATAPARCSRCQFPLDPVLAEVGQHIGC